MNTSKYEKLTIYFLIFLIVLLISYFSIFLSIAAIALLLVFFDNFFSKGVVAIFLIFSISYLQSEFSPESDSLQYLNYFKNVYLDLEGNEQLSSRTFELAWELYINGLSKLITPNFFFFCNTLVLYSLAMFASYKVDAGRGTYLMIFLIFCFLGFSNNLNFLIRQYYASILIILFFIFWEISTLRRVFFLLLSIGFHLSSIIYLPLINGKFVSFVNKKYLTIIFLSSLLSYLIDLDSIIYIYQKFEGAFFVDRLRYYNNQDTSSSIISIYFFEKVIFLSLILRVELSGLTSTEKRFRALLIYSFSLALVFSNIAVLSERLGMMFTLFFGFFVFIPLNNFNKISFFKFKINPILVFYFYLPFRIIFWGFSNEETHIIKYFSGNILSIGFNNFFS
ncbi:hypothetical protein F0251_04870 [Vibrio sp. 070316B]|uniref:EpsG family protein n=1 Tax=Vibrio sp. 070316B TaxID=2607608 RepID=UPI001493A63C|nr:EpsG family protein [Vibrio sp. 070316B]NOI37768.1 hypothetical protein [Vibrio sp. 070316B]